MIVIQWLFLIAAMVAFSYGYAWRWPVLVVLIGSELDCLIRVWKHKP